MSIAISFLLALDPVLAAVEAQGFGPAESLFSPVSFTTQAITKKLVFSEPDPDAFRQTTVFEIDTADDVLSDFVATDVRMGEYVRRDGSIVRVRVSPVLFAKQRVTSVERSVSPLQNGSSFPHEQALKAAPQIRGFKYIRSIKVVGCQRIGLWASGTTPVSTRVVLFDQCADSVTAPASTLLGEIPFKADLIEVSVGIDSPLWGVSVMRSETRDSPFMLANFLWFRRPATTQQ
ncbi:hypothetical protein ACMGDM_16340 [Sphingomonas sp. DT-51]